MSEYPAQGRAGGGVIAMKLPTADSRLGAACIVATASETLILITLKGKAKALKASAIPAAKRAGKGDFVMSVPNKDRVHAAFLYQPLVTLAIEAEAETVAS